MGFYLHDFIALFLGYLGGRDADLAGGSTSICDIGTRG